jgi:hypothetical protein
LVRQPDKVVNGWIVGANAKDSATPEGVLKDCLIEKVIRYPICRPPQPFDSQKTVIHCSLPHILRAKKGESMRVI